MQPHRIVAAVQGEIQVAENSVVFEPGPSRAVTDINNRKRLIAAYGAIEVAAAVLANYRLALGMVAELWMRGWDRLGCRLSRNLKNEHAGYGK